MEDRCKRCGRVIKNKTSIIRGYGSVCWIKANAEQQLYIDFAKPKNDDKRKKTK